MDYKYEIKENIVVYYIESPLDIGNSPLIQRHISALMDKYPDHDILLNMGQVEFMNSAGLGMLIIASKRLESCGRTLKVSNLSMSLKKVIDILDAHEIIDIYDTEEEALGSFAFSL